MQSQYRVVIFGFILFSFVVAAVTGSPAIGILTTTLACYRLMHETLGNHFVQLAQSPLFLASACGLCFALAFRQFYGYSLVYGCLCWLGFAVLAQKLAVYRRA